MARILPQEVDTIIVGNGPSALILSYILHGHIPIYDLSSPHPDPILHEKLKDSKDLLNLDIDHITEHFAASRFSYSTQALPINVLLDTLIRPNGETEEKETCVKWDYQPTRVVSHAVIGNNPYAGGQWVNNPVEASWDIGTLSYADMLSLPGYGIGEHYFKTYGRKMPFFLRPSRRKVADYYRAYPDAVGIADTIFNGVTFSDISRYQGGFHIGSHNIYCKHLVLASGIFTELIPPPPLLRPLEQLPGLPRPGRRDSILIIGSGFSAADVIISTPSTDKIIHMFKWAPKTSPSPLRACHQQAYPEYAGVYRKMKNAALAALKNGENRHKFRRASSTAFDLSRNWDSSYEGLPNTEIIEVDQTDTGFVVTFQNSYGDVFARDVSAFAYVVGRRGSFSYLQAQLRHEVAPELGDDEMVSAKTLRDQANEDLEVAHDVFITGSLTGDSLIRFAYGSATYGAGKIINGTKGSMINGCLEAKRDMLTKSFRLSPRSSPRIPAMNGLDGHERTPPSLRSGYNSPRRRKSDEIKDYELE